MFDPTRQLLTLDLSKLHMYSFGIVVECNKGSSTAKIFPMEKMWDKTKPNVDDLNKDKKETISVNNYKVKDIVVNSNADEATPTVESYTTTVKEIKLDDTKYIYAEWLQLGQSNRVTPPYLGIGEKVILFRFSNNDEYYWTTIDTKLSLRRNETVSWTFMKDKGNYGVTSSPGGGYMSVSTNGLDDGDLCNYSINLNPSDGYYLMVNDSTGNFNHITFSTKENAIFINIKKLWKLTTKGQVEMRMQDGIMIESKGDELIKLLIDLLTAMLQEEHVGNLGLPTPLESSSVKAYQAILKRLQKNFKIHKPSTATDPGNSTKMQPGPSGSGGTVTLPGGSSNGNGGSGGSGSIGSGDSGGSSSTGGVTVEGGTDVVNTSNGPQFYEDPTSAQYSVSPLVSNTAPAGSKTGDLVGYTSDGSPEVVSGGKVYVGEETMPGFYSVSTPVEEEAFY